MAGISSWGKIVAKTSTKDKIQVTIFNAARTYGRSINEFHARPTLVPLISMLYLLV